MISLIHAQEQAEKEIPPIEVLINTLSSDGKVVIEAEYIEQENQWWVLINPVSKMQYLTHEEAQGVVVIKKSPNIINELETISDKSAAQALIDQLVSVEITNNGGPTKTQAYVKNTLESQGPAAFSSIGTMVRAAYKSHGIDIP